jgi:actin-like ATPase involved in cell morphogenesis
MFAVRPDKSGLIAAANASEPVLKKTAKSVSSAIKKILSSVPSP